MGMNVEGFARAPQEAMPIVDAENLESFPVSTSPSEGAPALDPAYVPYTTIGTGVGSTVIGLQEPATSEDDGTSFGRLTPKAIVYKDTTGYYAGEHAIFADLKLSTLYTHPNGVGDNTFVNQQTVELVNAGRGFFLGTYLQATGGIHGIYDSQVLDTRVGFRSGGGKIDDNYASPLYSLSGS